MNRKFLKELFSTGLYILGVLLITYVIVTFVGQRTVVKGASMEPTLHGSDDRDESKIGDNLIVDKLSYRFHDPERFDIIVFPYQYGGGKEFYIKRIIGLPGETVQIDDEGNIYINGEILKEGYGKEVILNPGSAAEPITLGDDEYFVMGDNRNNSKDSRSTEIGQVDKREILGRVALLLLPGTDGGGEARDYSRIGMVD